MGGMGIGNFCFIWSNGGIPERRLDRMRRDNAWCLSSSSSWCGFAIHRDYTPLACSAKIWYTLPTGNTSLPLVRTDAVSTQHANASHPLIVSPTNNSSRCGSQRKGVSNVANCKSQDRKLPCLKCRKSQIANRKIANRPVANVPSRKLPIGSRDV